MSQQQSVDGGFVPGDNPLVSVVMTTYNGARYVRETIDSVLAQSLGDFEFIIVDDCSTDHTVDLIREYRDPRIALVRNEANVGISRSRNRALGLAKGTYIATTDQDDISERHRLERQVRHLEVNPATSVVASRVYLLRGTVRSVDPMPSQADPLLIHFALFFGRHNTTYSSLCARRQFIEQNDLYFRPIYHYAEDYELFSRIAECGRFAVLQEELVGYRLHAANNSKVHHKEMSRNGMTFMTACYARELGRAVNDEEGWAIWNGLVDKVPQTSGDQLRRLGQLMVELTASFIERRALNDQRQQAAIRQLAAQLWNEIVDRSVRTLGLEAERVRREIEDLQAWRPTAFRAMKSGALALYSTAWPRR
jgi:glycosyltransferase involved in cell wall biosynthesis